MSFSETLARIGQIHSKIDSLMGAATPVGSSANGEFGTVLAGATGQPATGTVGGGTPSGVPSYLAPQLAGAAGAGPQIKGVLAEAPPRIASAIIDAANKHGVDPLLVASVVKAESGFNPNAKSHAGAMGLMQLMPGTARGLGVTDPFNIEQNIDGGTRYLKGLLKRFEGDVRFALAGYNAGPGAVKRYGGVPPYKETQRYVTKVMGYYESSKAAATGQAADASSASRVSGGTGLQSKIIDEAKKYLGVPYVWGGNTPSQGFDCSGFTKWVYDKFDVKLPRVSKDQAYTGKMVGKGELQPGDLLFFARNGSRERSAVHHVGIYIGDGKMINAPSRGKDVRIESIETPYRQRELIWGRRLI